MSVDPKDWSASYDAFMAAVGDGIVIPEEEEADNWFTSGTAGADERHGHDADDDGARHNIRKDSPVADIFETIVVAAAMPAHAGPVPADELTPEKIAEAAIARANLAADTWEKEQRPLTPDEQEMLDAIAAAERERLGRSSSPGGTAHDEGARQHEPEPGPGEPEPEASRADPETTIGTRTALDLRHGMAPPQLAGPFLTADGPTVLYARGGTGKGLLACWFALQLVRAGHVVMVVDFEGHELEWGSRLRGLGLTDDELGRIHYRAPFGSDWTAPTGSLAAVADAIREDAARLGVTYLVVDSYSVATSNGDTMGGEAAAREYFSGLARIGLPSLTIAHVRGDSGKFPERPFGSVFVHNLARETWAVEQLGDGEAETIDPDEIRYGPHVVALELRNQKANARPKSPAQFVTFSFFADGTIDVTTDGPAGRSVADLAADALAAGPLTMPKIAAAIKEDTGQAVGENALSSALRRHPLRFVQDKSGKRPYPWSLR